ncbi:MAG: Ger(x)C family spore germination C-terminal domain-containing protein, partial [Clostridia bacterium]
TPISSKSNIENMGLAVFKGGKLVGELTGLETIYHLIISNELQSCDISIPNPIGDSETLDLNLKLGNKTKNELTFVNGTPYISTNISLDIKILSTTEASTEGNSNYYNKENTELIEKACNEYLQNSITQYLYKTSRSYQSDIDGFGKYAVKYFYTMQDWKEYDWLNNYENSIFNVTVKSSLKSGYTFL